jgi:protein TonB
MREPNRTYIARGIALVVTVLLHGMLIYLFATHKITASAASVPPVLVAFIDKPPRPAVQLTTAVTLMRPKLSPITMPEAAIEIPVQVPAPQASLSGQDPDLSASEAVLDEHGTGAGVSGVPSNSGDGGPGITIARRVQPIYSDASVRAREQGYVSVALLIDERGHVSKVEVVTSSGFRRLDQSVMDALRQWTFTRRADGSPPTRTRATFDYVFHLTSAYGLALSLMPYDPALAEQIRAAAVPKVATPIPMPKGVDALRRLIAKIQTATPAVGRDFRGPPPAVQLVVKFGAVKSIQFLGIESRGLDFNAAKQAIDLATRKSQVSQWELYKVTQRSGVSEWLIDVTRNGAITNAQALICATSCPDF